MENELNHPPEKQNQFGVQAYTPPKRLDLDTLANAVASKKDADLQHTQMCVLVAVSAVAQDIFEVRTHYGASKPVGIWVVASMTSGFGKTKAIQELAKTLHSYEHEARERADAEARRFELDKKIHTAQENELVRRIAKNPVKRLPEHETQLEQHYQHAPSQPKTFRRIVTNATIQGLLRQMAESRFGAFIEGDESLSVMQMLMTGKTPYMCEFYDGNSVQVGRATTGTIEVTNPRLTAMFLLQPEILRDFMAKHEKAGLSSGVWLRTLAYQIEDASFTRVGFDGRYGWATADEVIGAYEDKMRKLLAMAEEMAQSKASPKVLEFTAEAYKRIGEWEQHAKCYLFPQDADSVDYIKSYQNRMLENFYRLAALVHVLQTDDYELHIGIDTVMVVERLMNSLIAHFVHLFYSGGADQEQADELAVMRALTKTIPPLQPFDSAQLHNITPNNLRRSKDKRFIKAIDRLEQKGFIETARILNPNTGKSIKMYLHKITIDQCGQRYMLNRQYSGNYDSCIRAFHGILS